MIETLDETVGNSHSSASRLWWLALSLLLSQLLGCSSRAPVDTVAELSLPLTFESSSERYRLAASFLIFDHQVTDDTEEDPVLQLVSPRPPTQAEPQLRTELPPGQYWILVRNWRLYRAEGEEWEPIEATPVANPVSALLSEGQTTTVRFGFVRTPAPAQTGGTLIVELEVFEGSLCGNGIVEPGETCDDGWSNGLPNKCDETCSYTIRPPSPLRVDPGSETGGSGTSWGDAMNDLQAALDQQSQAGGGAVWVLGGRFPSLVSHGETLLDVPPDVDLLGGFSGIEMSPEERDPDNEPTWLDRPDFDSQNPLPLITLSDVSNVLIERFAVDEAASAATSLLVDGSSDVVFRDFTVRQYGLGPAYAAVLDQSGVRIEQSDIEVDTQYLSATDSDLAIVATELSGSTYGGLLAENSRLLLQDVVSNRPLSLTEGSRVLLNRSIVNGSSERGGMITSDGELTLVSSALLDDVTGDTPIIGDSVFVFDSTFAGLTAASAGGSTSSAAAIEANSVEVALSTFFDTQCSETAFLKENCRVPVLVHEQGTIHNTLAVAPAPEPTNPYPIDPYDWFFGVSEGQLANCATFELDAFQRSPELPERVLATEHPCIDAGDAELLEASRLRLFARVGEFFAYPFNADLSRYESPDFWRDATVRTDTSDDLGAPDPGRHWQMETP